MSHCSHRSAARSPLVIGVVLLLIGSGLLAANLGYEFPEHLWQYWPLVLIVPGLAAVVFPNQHLRRPSGVWLLATGLYAEASMHQWLGLHWGSAWPIFIIGWGVAVLLDKGSSGKGGSDQGGSGGGGRVIHEG